MLEGADKSKRVLAVASAGGHWVQLMRLRPALEGADLAFVTTHPGYADDVGDARYYVVKDANRWDKIGLLQQVIKLAWIVVKERPDIVVTTGAAPGYFTIRLARLLGARTAWIDSIANAEELSLSGRMAGKFADLWLTQWPELARAEGPAYEGAVL